MVNTISENTRQYQSSFLSAGKSDGGFSSALEKQLENNFDFSDMYIRTHQHLLGEACTNLSAALAPWKNTKYQQVPVAGDLRELMESIEKGIAEGESLRDILQSRIDRYAKECGEPGVIAVGTMEADIILIDPDTGRVFDSMPKDRCIIVSQELDRSMAKAQADDLATFIRYTVFKQEPDDPEKISALLTELKEKQSGYDTSRFLPIFYSRGEKGWENAKYLRRLLGLDDDEEESDEDGSDEAADELIRIVGERNSSGAGNNSRADDGIRGIMDTMNAENIGKSKIARRVLKEALL